MIALGVGAFVLGPVAIAVILSSNHANFRGLESWLRHSRSANRSRAPTCCHPERVLRARSPREPTGMPTEDSSLPRGLGAGAQSPMSRRYSAGSDSSSRDRAATRWPDPADTGRPRHRRNHEGGVDPPGCRFQTPAAGDAASQS